MSDFRSFVPYAGENNYIEINIIPFPTSTSTYLAAEDWLVIEIPKQGNYDKD